MRQDQEQLRLFSKLVQRKRREQETPDEAKARRLADRLSKRRRLEQETPQQTRERRKGNLNIEVSNRSKMETSMELDESFYEVVHVLETTFICQGCGATSTSTSIPIDQTVELTCISCHRKSKTKLPDIPPHPLANAEKKFNCMNESMAMEVETNDPLKFAKKVRTPKVSSNKQLFKVFGDKLCDFCGKMNEQTKFAIKLFYFFSTGNKFTTKSSIVNHMKMHQTKEPARERVKIF